MIMYKDNHIIIIIICFFFNDTATTEIYTLSLHDALPILGEPWAPIASGERTAAPSRDVFNKDVFKLLTMVACRDRGLSAAYPFRHTH